LGGFSGSLTNPALLLAPRKNAVRYPPAMKGMAGMLSLVLSLAACGGAATYAGITKGEAEAQAQRAILKFDYQGRQRLYDADKVQAGDLLKRKNGRGQDAWLVTFSDKFGNEACVYVWQSTANANLVSYEETACP
jgi:hypothetical protein